RRGTLPRATAARHRACPPPRRFAPPLLGEEGRTEDLPSLRRRAGRDRGADRRSCRPSAPTSPSASPLRLLRRRGTLPRATAARHRACPPPRRFAPPLVCLIWTCKGDGFDLQHRLGSPCHPQGFEAR